MQRGAGSVMVWACMTANGMSDHVNADRSGMICDVYRCILSSHIQPNTAELIGQCWLLMSQNVMHLKPF